MEHCTTTQESGHGGLCPHPPRNLRFLGFSFCCRVFGRRALQNQTKAQAVTTTALRRRFEQRPLQKRTAAGKPPPRRRSPRRLSAAAVARGLRPLCPHPPRNLRFLGFSFCCRAFGRNLVCSESYSTILNSFVSWFSVSTPVSVTATRSSTRTPKRPGR